MIEKDDIVRVLVSTTEMGRIDENTIGVVTDVTPNGLRVKYAWRKIDFSQHWQCKKIGHITKWKLGINGIKYVFIWK